MNTNELTYNEFLEEANRCICKFCIYILNDDDNNNNKEKCKKCYEEYLEYRKKNNYDTFTK